MAKLKIGIIGCAGRMGRMLIRATLLSKECQLVAGSERKGSPFIGKDMGMLAEGEKTSALVTADSDAVFAAADAVIDFTAPESTVECAKLAAKYKKIHVIGTTGLSKAQLESIEASAKKAPIFMASNMSVGVSMLSTILEKVAAELPADNWDIEVIEMHHRNKVDAPSGTALTLGKAAAKGRKTTLDKSGVYERYGQTGARKNGTIGFATLRGGDVVGEHTVMFTSTFGERIEFTHKATDRAIFAHGAVRYALLMADKKAGLYGPDDIL
ncbi:MAG: 4-hydroxy-tetrahydrodipicolinate reductase [Proteobacteria bacterium]|nr:4-hydroxy-tetrahydrodipicolinate reductase [Pseudomonadota bacterium]